MFGATKCKENVRGKEVTCGIQTIHEYLLVGMERIGGVTDRGIWIQRYERGDTIESNFLNVAHEERAESCRGCDGNG